LHLRKAVKNNEMLRKAPGACVFSGLIEHRVQTYKDYGRIVTKARQFRGFRKSLTVMNSRNMKKKKKKKKEIGKQEEQNHRGFVSKARQFRGVEKILDIDEHEKKKRNKIGKILEAET
jgi:hypothetical protein